MQNEINDTQTKISPVVILRTVYHSLAHFSNDLFLAFFAPTLPVLITRMNLLKVQAGVLNLGMELMALTMPLVGHLADKKDIRKYMFLTPAITALCMSSLTLIPNFYLLFIVLIVGGLSIYFYHAIGPADIGQVNEKSLGSMMAIWNIAGQVGFFVGPLVITAILTNGAYDKLPYLFLVGVLLSAILYVLWNKMPAAENQAVVKETHQRKLDRETRNHLVRQFVPIVGISITNSLIRSSAYAYLPVYIVERGGSLWMSGLSVSIYFGAGVIGNYIGGVLYDRIGSKWTTAISLLGFALSFTATIFATGIGQLALIGVMGVFGFMLMPTLMAMLQKNNPQDRSLTNGLFLGFTYSITALGSVVVGYMLDHGATQTVFLINAAIGLTSLVFVPFLVDCFPTKGRKPDQDC
ncbi:MAG: transporter, family, fosmidomycin resistance protein [Chloroflexota bacterium]|nr:transporter, family, fosmidomycin resistance protein [Chloroflexota bacterium]